MTNGVTKPAKTARTDATETVRAVLKFIAITLIGFGIIAALVFLGIVVPFAFTGI